MAYTLLNTGINQEKGITYAATTDTIADWGNVPANSYFYDFSTDLPYYKNSSGDVLEIFSEAGVSSNLYTANGTLTGDRTVNLGTNIC